MEGNRGRARRRRWRCVLERRIALERWYPHLAIAALIAPLGLLLITASVEAALGTGLPSIDLSDVANQLPRIEHRPVIETALGLSLISMSVGLALRSWLAWIWSVDAMAVGVAFRIPPETANVPSTLHFAAVLVLLLLHRRHLEKCSVLTSSVFAVVVLGVNELDATVPTVAALNDPANHFHLQRAQPSMLLSLQSLGGQLLATALTGERVDLDMLTGVLQVHETEPVVGNRRRARSCDARHCRRATRPREGIV